MSNNLNEIMAKKGGLKPGAYAFDHYFLPVIAEIGINAEGKVTVFYRYFKINNRCTNDREALLIAKTDCEFAVKKYATYRKQSVRKKNICRELEKAGYRLSTEISGNIIQ